jgi:GNAT superfamily N-acetyltransferase
MDGLNEAARSYLEAKNTPTSLYQELRQYYTLVLEEDDVIVGLGSLDRNELKRMYTHPTAQGKGVGRRIMLTLEEEAKRQGIQRLDIKSSPSAAGFYRKFGYEDVGCGSLRIGEASFHFINMEKGL